MVWRGNANIRRWGITWRQTSPSIPATLEINAEVPTLMMSHGMTLLKISAIEDDSWPDAVAILLAVHPEREGAGDDDFIVGVLNAKLCHHDLCAGAQDKGVQFSNGFAEEGEDVLDAFMTVEVEKDRINSQGCLAA